MYERGSAQTPVLHCPRWRNDVGSTCSGAVLKAAPLLYVGEDSRDGRSVVLNEQMEKKKLLSQILTRTKLHSAAASESLGGSARRGRVATKLWAPSRARMGRGQWHVAFPVKLLRLQRCQRLVRVLQCPSAKASGGRWD